MGTSQELASRQEVSVIAKMRIFGDWGNSWATWEGGCRTTTRKSRKRMEEQQVPARRLALCDAPTLSKQGLSLLPSGKQSRARGSCLWLGGAFLHPS